MKKAIEWAIIAGISLFLLGFINICLTLFNRYQRTGTIKLNPGEGIFLFIGLGLIVLGVFLSVLRQFIGNDRRLDEDEN